MHNQVANALSWKELTEFVGSLSRVVAYLIVRVKQEALQDFAYIKLVEQVKEGITKRYLLEDELLHFVSRKLYLSSRKLR